MKTRPIHNQPRRRFGNRLDHFQPVLLQRAPSLDQIHNAVRKTEQRREFD